MVPKTMDVYGSKIHGLIWCQSPWKYMVPNSSDIHTVWNSRVIINIVLTISVDVWSYVVPLAARTLSLTFWPEKNSFIPGGNRDSPLPSPPPLGSLCTHTQTDKQVKYWQTDGQADKQTLTAYRRVGVGIIRKKEKKNSTADNLWRKLGWLASSSMRTCVIDMWTQRLISDTPLHLHYTVTVLRFSTLPSPVLLLPFSPPIHCITKKAKISFLCSFNPFSKTLRPFSTTVLPLYYDETTLEYDGVTLDLTHRD